MSHMHLISLPSGLSNPVSTRYLAAVRSSLAELYVEKSALWNVLIEGSRIFLLRDIEGRFPRHPQVWDFPDLVACIWILPRLPSLFSHVPRIYSSHPECFLSSILALLCAVHEIYQPVQKFALLHSSANSRNQAVSAVLALGKFRQTTQAPTDS